MTVTRYSLPGVVDLRSAANVAEELMAHVNVAAAPAVNAFGLRQAGVVLLQLLVAARRMATAQGKTFTVEAAPDGVLTTLLAACGLDPVLCGMPATPFAPTPSAPIPPLPQAAEHMQRR